MRWSYGRFSESPFIGLFSLSHCCADGVFLDRPVHNPLPQKDATCPIRLRVQLAASKTSIRLRYGRFSETPFFCLLLLRAIEIFLPVLEQPLPT